MSSFSIIQDTGRELRRQIFEALQATPDTDFPLTGDINQIMIAPPSDDLPDGTLAVLFLYHIDIDKHQRNQRPLADRNDATLQRKPPLPLHFRFLFAPVGDDETINHLVLGRVFQRFYDAPTVSMLDGAPVGDSFGGSSQALRIKPDMLTVEQLSQLWNALSTPYRLSLSLLVDAASIDSGLQPRRVPRVEELLPAVGIMDGG